MMAMLLAGLAGCGREAPPPVRLSPLPPDAVILIYAAGIGGEVDFFRSVPLDEAVGSVMQRRVVSRGQSGELIEKALKRLPDVLEQCDPDLMVLGYGAMDLWKETAPEKIEAGLAAMVDMARARNTQVVLLAMPNISRLSVRPDPVYERVAREKNIPVETGIVRAVLNDSSLHELRYKVNDDGIQRLAEALRTLIVQCGGLPE